MGSGQLTGQVAAITGGSAGIGLGIAQAFVNEGARVLLMGRNPAKGAAAVATLGGDEHAAFYSGDVMQQAQVEGFVDAAIEQFGRLDILVNNAGGAGDLQPMVALSDETFDKR